MLVKIRDFIRKYTQIVFFLGLFVVGAAFAVFGVISLGQPRVEGVEVEATIVEIVKEEVGTNADGYTEFEYTVYVDYTDKNGNAHTHVELPRHDDDMVVGNQVAAKYDPNDPDTLVGDDSLFLTIIFLAVGVVAAAFAVVKIVRTIRTKDINEFNRVDMTTVSASEIESVKNSTEEQKEYYFHFTGEMNQSYVLETMERTPVYEAHCDKMGIVSNYEFTFINHFTGTSEKHLVSHVVTSSYDNFVNSSKFRIDNENVWDVLGKAGYSMDPHLNGFKSYFDVARYGIPVAKIELAGTKAYKEGAGKILGDVPVKGMFKVYAKASDIDMVFLCAFILSKVDLF